MRAARSLLTRTTALTLTDARQGWGCASMAVQGADGGCAERFRADAAHETRREQEDLQSRLRSTCPHPNGAARPLQLPQHRRSYYLQNNAAQRGEMERKQQEDGGGSRSLDPARVKKRSRQAKNRLNSASRTPQCGRTLFQVTSTKASGPRAVEARHPTVKKEALSARKEGARLSQKRRDRDPEGSLREEGLSAQPRSGPVPEQRTWQKQQLQHQSAMKPHVDEE